MGLSTRIMSLYANLHLSNLNIYVSVNYGNYELVYQNEYMIYIYKKETPRALI